jgi:Protein of unknown function (Hypoth_ymh)
VRPQQEDEVQYVGVADISARCLDSIRRLLQFGDRVVEAKLLTCDDRHAFLLRVENDERIVVKSGFMSGYSGEGPRVLSEALALLDSHGCHIEEIDVRAALLARLNASRMRAGDIEVIEQSPPRRPIRWYDYLYAEHRVARERHQLWRAFPPVVPFGIIDPRLQDIARELFTSPDNALLTGFRRLEDTVRIRIVSDKHGAELFKLAFMGIGSRLIWPALSQSEADARANLFVNAYSAYRNPRAHRELAHSTEQVLTEFLLINHLFLLETSTVNR